MGVMPPTPLVNEEEIVALCGDVVTEMLEGRKVAVKTTVNGGGLAENQLPVPPHIMTINKDVKMFDKTKVHMDKAEIVSCFNNIVGEVESILSDHHAIVKFKPLNSQNEYRVLCLSDDVFNLDFPEAKSVNPHKFGAAWDLWKETAKVKKISLRILMKPGNKVRLNVVPVLSNYPNNA